MDVPRSSNYEIMFKYALNQIQSKTGAVTLYNGGKKVAAPRKTQFLIQWKIFVDQKLMLIYKIVYLSKCLQTRRN